MAYVFNERAGAYAYVCCYDKRWNVFKNYVHGRYDVFPMDVTHWIPLPIPVIL